MIFILFSFILITDILAFPNPIDKHLHEEQFGQEKEQHPFTAHRRQGLALLDNYLDDRNKLLSTISYIRMRRCRLRFPLKGICDNNIPFFMWAQSIAKDILDGNLEEQ